MADETIGDKITNAFNYCFGSESNPDHKQSIEYNLDI